MGIVSKAVLGSISGGVGPVVFAPYRDLSVVKSEPKKSSRPAVQSQIDQRLKFKLVTEFLSALSTIIVAGYQSAVKSMSPMNAAVRYHLDEAVTGTSPDFTIDYSKVKLSNVSRVTIFDTEVTQVPGNTLELTWGPSEEKDADLKALRDTDAAVIVFYGEKTNMFLDLTDTALRGDGNCTAKFHRMFNGDTVHGWMFFLSADKKTVFKSHYLGDYKLMA